MVVELPVELVRETDRRGVESDGEKDRFREDLELVLKSFRTEGRRDVSVVG